MHASGGAVDPVVSAQLHQLAVAAHQYAQAAQQCAAMGYSHDVVHAYLQHAQQCSYWYHHLASSAGVASPIAAAEVMPSAVDAAAAATVVDESSGVNNVPPAGVAAPVPADDEANRFARAGHEADPGFEDRDEVVPPAQLTLRARILESLALMLKLAFFLVYFGSHVNGWRYAALVLLCVVTLLYQGGWIQRGRDGQQGQGPRNPAAVPDQQAADNAAGAAAATESDDDDNDEEEEQNGLDADGAASADNTDGERARDARIADGVAVAPERVGASATTSAAPNEAVVPPPRPTLMRVVSTIVIKFFLSMVPGMLERQVE